MFEVRSEGDTSRGTLEKVGEYLLAGVFRWWSSTRGKGAHVYSEEQPSYFPEDELTFPGILEGFRVPVHRFF